MGGQVALVEMADEADAQVADAAVQQSDGTFGGVQPAETGLIRSRNTMSVRVGALVSGASRPVAPRWCCSRSPCSRVLPAMSPVSASVFQPSGVRVLDAMRFVVDEVLPRLGEHPRVPSVSVTLRATMSTMPPAG